MHFAGKFSRASGPEGSAFGVADLSMSIHPKSCSIFPKTVAANLLSGSRKDAVGA